MNLLNDTDTLSAKQAIAWFWRLRDDLPDTCTVAETIDYVREIMSEAKESGLKLLDYAEKTGQLESLADAVDEACDDAGLPRLFRTEE